jgi:hypothetical protein
MKRYSLAWILSSLAVLGVGAITLWLGQTLMPPRTTAATVGTLVPWFITWGIIWMTALIAVVIAVNILSVGLTGGRSTR